MRFYLFTIGQKNKLRVEWASLKCFKKWYYFLFNFNSAKDTNSKTQFYDLIILGFLFRFTRPYIHKFSYKNMPKIKGRRKI